MRAYALWFLSASAILGLLGCDPHEGGGTCPDPRDPGVHYVSHEPECPGIDFACSPAQTPFSDECGCGCIGPEPAACPDPRDPEVRYVSHDPRECQLIDFDCSWPQTLFSDECGCGCIGPEPEACPDPNDPEVHYVSRDELECQLIDFICPEGQEYMSGIPAACGCGCIGPEPAACPDPRDPEVRYVSHDPGECAVIDFDCSPPERFFSGECGCGCIGPDPLVGRSH
ncbi:uncharacterized protein SOCE26_010650 [Sorangium cellulosum]|uniref:Uncharacterized protein n=1 Tax=Sorangium cellulosum TaxID=56 RepID=A0A2L0EK49_SORCE|nr:hypothetical protein [Sorangium cellulosum]AUX39670.1 uncharacterized protein SOCE26_010650 [Sorangium cellulosum]